MPLSFFVSFHRIIKFDSIFRLRYATCILSPAEPCEFLLGNHPRFMKKSLDIRSGIHIVMTMKLLEGLSQALNEKDVENVWRAFLSKKYSTKEKDCIITSPLKTDGYFESLDARVICEFKDDLELSETTGYLTVIAQSIFYLKKFQEEGMPLPNVVFAADRNECFVIGTACLMPYLSKAYDWSIAPSQAYKHLPLMSDLIKDENIIPVVFKLNDEFSFEPIRLCIQNTSLQAKSNTTITAQNIVRVFEYWVGNVLRDGEKMDPKDILDTFLMLLCQPQECYIHPKKTHFLMIGNKEVRVKPTMYKAFFTLYKETHNPLELREITANKDRLLQEVHRRRTGAFFTPSLWVDEAHNMIAEQFGADWKEKYVVWDCSCGTLNLTRDYQFKELYCSTLDQSDIDLATLRGYNPEAVKFQFDFLNDDETKLPDGLKKALAENKPIIFLNNPPYKTAADLDLENGSGSDGVATDTVTSKQMKKEGMGTASKQLYCQFIYKMNSIFRSHNITQCGICTFTVASLLSGEGAKHLRCKLLESVSYKDGMLFQASHFTDVKGKWGISFTIFSA